MDTKNFDSLLKASYLQEQPQRLLFLFAKATPLENATKTDHKTGTIEPVMCVDKLPADIASFDALVKEADAITNKWDFILIGSLSGSNGHAPSTEDATPYLNTMTNNLATGKDISRYVVIDREQRQVMLA